MTGVDDEPGPGAEPPDSGLPDDAQQSARLTAWVAGRVQGVGFRWWVRSRALELGLAGAAENLEDGRVRVVAEGSREGCRALLALLQGPGAPGRVARVTHRWDNPKGQMTGFIER